MIDEKLWDKKADDGDGLYAVALAILDLSASVDRLGLNYKNPDGVMGTTEKIAVALDEMRGIITEFITHEMFKHEK